MTLMTLSVLAALAVALLSAGAAGVGENRALSESIGARYVAEAGLSQAIAGLRVGGTGVVGNAQAPVTYSDGRFWVERADPAVDVVRFTATGQDERETSRVELTLRRRIQSIWAYGAFGDETLTMDSNARVDSYNSALGTYAAQAVNGSGGSGQYALSNGDVGSNGDIVMDQNSKTWGDATCGPSATTTVMGNAVCAGATTPAVDANILPTITVPSLTSLGDKTITGTLNLAPGNYRYDAFLVKTNAIVNVTGPATIVVSNFTMRSGAQFKVNAAGGNVVVYVIDDFLLNSNTLITSTDYIPSKVEFNLLSDNVIDPMVMVDLDQIDFNSNAKMYGTILAPNAHIEINSNFELFGAMVAHSIDLDSNCRVHYDESLLAAKGGGTVTWERLCWRPLAN